MEEKELWMNKLKEKLGNYSEPLLLPVGNNWKKNLCLCERKISLSCKWTQ